MADQPVVDWEDVARRYGRKIYNFAYRLTGNPDDAADLVQEVLLRVRKGLANYTPGSFEGWLWRITRNAFLDGVRKKKRRPTTELPDEGKVFISVKDNGPGIPAKHFPRLFEQFYRVKNRENMHVTGSGLGLKIVKSIISHHNGEVWCESTPGAGATFFISLPIRKPIDRGAQT